jgi:hypothetical protein
MTGAVEADVLMTFLQFIKQRQAELRRTRATRRHILPIRRWVSPVYRDYPDAEYRGR